MLNFHCIGRIDGGVMLIFRCIMPFQQVATWPKRLGEREIHTLRVLKVCKRQGLRIITHSALV